MTLWAAISNAFDQLGGDVFDRELAKELGMSASTLNRWKSIGSSRVIAENARCGSTGIFIAV